MQRAYLFIILLCTTYLQPTLYIPIQTYSGLQKEAQKLVNDQEKFMKIYKKPYNPYDTREDRLHHLSRLKEIATKWKKDKKLFDRAMQVSEKIGTIDSKQAFRIRMIIQMPRRSDFNINTIIAEIKHQIKSLN